MFSKASRFAAGVLVLTLGCAGSMPSARTDLASSVYAPTLPRAMFDYVSLDLPTHFMGNGRRGRGGRGNASVVASDNTPAGNPSTNAGATLGRVLFHDRKLSVNGTVACASCHIQAFGFSDTLRTSSGFDSGSTRRHSMSLANARFYRSGKFFWDERAGTLEQQVLQPIQDRVEMGMSLPRLVSVVQDQPYYPALFAAAFGTSQVTVDRIARALAQYVRSIVSTRSRYDSARAGAPNARVDFALFTAQENLGKRLFMAPGQGRTPCSDCHTGEAFIADAPRRGGRGGTNTDATNNGLDALSDSDRGVTEVTGNGRDAGKFKTPSLRNIAVTAPYMHDGRFATLDEVIEHYSSGIRNHPNLDRALRSRDGAPRQYGFTATEKAAIVAFLQTLTDRALLADERFSDPFRR
jgi:cytochrome c peroxidase